MELSQKGYDLITSFEGYLKPLPDGSCKAYRCPAGVWTAGFGCTEGVGPDTHWTREQADENFKRELTKHEKIVSRLVTVDLTQGQFDSLVSFSYNCGGLQGSTLLKKLNKGDYIGASNEFRYWTKAFDPKTKKRVELAGLVRRRKAESALFVSDMIGSDEMPQAAVEKRPVVVQVAENAGTIGKALAGVGVAGGAVATQTAEAPKTKPSVKAQLETGKEIKANVEVAKDLGTFAHDTYKWASGPGLFPSLMIIIPLVALLGYARWRSA